MVSDTISSPSPGCFSPFPHGTGSLSIAAEYLVLAHSHAGFPQGFSSPVVLKNTSRRVITPFAYRALTVSGPPFQGSSTREVIPKIGSPSPGPSALNRQYLATHPQHIGG